MPNQLSPNQSPAPKDVELLRVSIADYLARERTASVRHEFYYGEITEMPGGTFEHGNIGVDFLVALAFLLHAIKSDCEVHWPDQKIYIEPGVFYYPDFSVVCGSPQVYFDESLRNPIVIVEVLSESTKKKDRDEKKREYQRIPSLRHYILVEQNTPRIENYEKNAVTGLWRITPTIVKGLDEVLTLSALNVSVPLAEIYRRASFAD